MSNPGSSAGARPEGGDDSRGPGGRGAGPPAPDAEGTGGGPGVGAAAAAIVVTQVSGYQGKLIDETKVYSLCSEGNRRIIQSSYDKNRLQTIADMLNQEQELMSGVKYEKFFILEPL